MIRYRVATHGDIPRIIDMCHKLFYNESFTIYENDLYVIAVEEDGSIVGISGLTCPDDSIFEDYEIAYTGVLKEYRGQGICTELLRIVLDGVEDTVYCSAWRTWDNAEKAHLRNILLRHGFVLAEPGYVHFAGKYFCNRTRCAYAHENIKECECWEDIYVRRPPQEVGDFCE